jgi:hypothetical protein
VTTDQQRLLAGIVSLAERLIGRCQLMASEMDPDIAAEMVWLVGCCQHALPVLRTAAGDELPPV